MNGDFRILVFDFANLFAFGRCLASDNDAVLCRVPVTREGDVFCKAHMQEAEQQNDSHNQRNTALHVETPFSSYA